MSFWANLKNFFGFGQKALKTSLPSTVDQFKAKLAMLPETERHAFLEQSWTMVEAGAVRMVATARGQTGNATQFFSSACGHFSLEVFLYTALHPELTQKTEGNIDKSYEQILHHLISYAEVHAKPSPELLAMLDVYIQDFEEAIYLAEAAGEYRLQTSENGKWVRFPFLQDKQLKPGRKQEAELKLAHLFVPCPELSLLALDTHVPWQPISFVDIIGRNKFTRMALLHEPNTHTYYAYSYS